MKGKPAVLNFKYRFNFENGKTTEFTIQLRRNDLGLVAEPGASQPPEWTRLEFNQCPNCPLRKETHPYCPIAVNVVDVVNFFKDVISYEKTYVTIETDSRTYIGKVSVQEGIKSLMGLFMATSGCPVMDKLRPMAATHLPFPTIEESIYRLLSMYLLAQYFVLKDGGHPDWEMKKLLDICNEIQTVNRSFFKRIKQQGVKDASLNAIVALDSFATYTASSLEDNNLDEMRELFKGYLRHASKR
jgi:hypothetical protein